MSQKLSMRSIQTFGRENPYIRESSLASHSAHRASQRTHNPSDPNHENRSRQSSITKAYEAPNHKSIFKNSSNRHSQ